METISNRLITVGISSHGAELQSIVDNVEGRECLWQGDPAYWKRRSPVLFPIVGSLWEGKCRIDGREYAMSQHGFARDMDFTLVSNNGTEAWFALESSDESRKMFPRDFLLEIGYRLRENTLDVMWRVSNRDCQPMDFQIGAHPAFNYADYDASQPVQAYFLLSPARDEYVLSVIGEKGCLKAERLTLKAQDGVLPIDISTFNGDALILEASQVSRVVLCDRQRKPRIAVDFDAPLVGLWSPARNGYAPFVCIEPWYGRCDSEHYEGEYAGKDWVQHLQPGGQFAATYSITVMH